MTSAIISNYWENIVDFCRYEIRTKTRMECQIDDGTPIEIQSYGLSMPFYRHENYLGKSCYLTFTEINGNTKMIIIDSLQAKEFVNGKLDQSINF